MTLGELVHSLDKPSIGTVCLVVLIYFEKFEDKQSATVGEMRDALKNSGCRREAKANLSDALGKSMPNIRIAGTNGRSNLWALTSTGRRSIISQLSLEQSNEPINEAGSLKSLATSLNSDQAAYIIEATKCLEADALHAAVVFLWAGAVREIQEHVVKCNNKAIDLSISKRDPKAPKVRKIDHLCYVKESTLLLVAEDLGIFDRNERDMLDACLKLRNKCGHPGKYKPGPKKIASFIEDIAGIVFGA